MSWLAMLTVCVPMADGAMDCIRIPFRPSENAMVWETKEDCTTLIPAITVLVDHMLAVEGWPDAEVRDAHCELPRPIS
jgi:hypothetical protein